MQLDLIAFTFLALIGGFGSALSIYVYSIYDVLDHINNPVPVTSDLLTSNAAVAVPEMDIDTANDIANLIYVTLGIVVILLGGVAYFFRWLLKTTFKTTEEHSDNLQQNVEEKLKEIKESLNSTTNAISGLRDGFTRDLRETCDRHGKVEADVKVHDVRLSNVEKRIDHIERLVDSEKDAVY